MCSQKPDRQTDRACARAVVHFKKERITQIERKTKSEKKTKKGHARGEVESLSFYVVYIVGILKGHTRGEVDFRV